MFISFSCIFTSFTKFCGPFSFLLGSSNLCIGGRIGKLCHFNNKMFCMNWGKLLLQLVLCQLEFGCHLSCLYEFEPLAVYTNQYRLSHSLYYIIVHVSNNVGLGNVE